MKHLPKWKKYQKLLNKSKNINKKSTIFGFRNTEHIDGDVVRVDARYSLAKSFEGMVLPGYTQNTVEGYNAIMKAMLVYSAFESYVNAIEDKTSCGFYDKALNLLDTKSREKMSNRILELDKDKKFYEFILKNLDHGKHKKQLKKFYNNEEHNQVYLLSTIRHIFAHGILTPHSKGVKPTRVVKICNALSNFFLEQIENDFKERVEGVFL